MNALLEIGFRRVGKWQLEEETLALQISEMAEVKPVLYAFAVSGKLMYVGKTVQALEKRLYGYLKGGSTQRTNIRVRGEIETLLRDISHVDIYAFEDKNPQKIGKFRLNIPAALEDDIIKQLRPPWNGGRQVAETITDVHLTKREQSAPSTKQLKEDFGRINEFVVRIGKAYYSQGFFNVPVVSSEQFDRDGASITILVGADERRITGRINRTANSTKTPRIMGGTLLRDWIQDSVGMGNLLHVTVSSKKVIRLKKG